MAYVKHNMIIEYQSNTIEFRMLDAYGNPENFDTGTVLRISDNADTHTVTFGPATSLPDSMIRFIIPTLDNTTLLAAGGVSTQYDSPEYNYVYSIRSTNKIYVIGKLAIVKVA